MSSTLVIVKRDKKQLPHQLEEKPLADSEWAAICLDRLG